MKIYKLKGTGNHIKAEDNMDAVRQLNEISFFGKKEFLEEFMEKTGGTCQLQDGSEIRTGNFDEFIDDLVKCGYLIEIDRDKEE